MRPRSGPIPPPRLAELPIQIKRLNLSKHDIVVARVDPSALHGQLHRVAAEIRKCLIAAGHADTILLVLPSTMNVTTVARLDAQQALEKLASYDATAIERQQAIEKFDKES